VSLLTGTEVKGGDQIDRDGLAAIVSSDEKAIDCSQFNELLLMVHKDRVEAPFFEHFWGTGCTVGAIPQAVEEFQKAALLLYGNFVFGYRKLSRIKDTAEFRDAISEAAKDPDAELKSFKNRKPKLLDIDRIDRDQTPFVGYLSAFEVRADLRRCELLRTAAEETEPTATWDQYLDQVRAMANPKEIGSLEAIISNYRAVNSHDGVSAFASFLEGSLQRLKELNDEVDTVCSRATRNQGTYLTWDHMDVYFATSMRKSWEYRDLYDFIDRLMVSEELKELDLRYFDPTQAFTDNRINKGLVEALMLKRARCTVYSVQDTDTLGKDSELASTLAQGKPVIAYVPDLDPHERAQQLLSEDPATILERLRFVLYADERLGERLTKGDYDVVDKMQDALDEFCGRRIWFSVRDDKAVRRFREDAGADLERFCAAIATAEKAVYDKRANTLKEIHPLALQVNLDTGVANGVLAVRTIPDCAALLRCILLGHMKFFVKEENGMWYLREEISGCIYRVVTNDRKLNNCFWNFYLR
jgi:hypothetical protein